MPEMEGAAARAPTRVVLPWIVTLAALVAGGAIRFARLDLHDAWADEGITWTVAESGHPIDLLVAHMNGEPPVYHLAQRWAAGPQADLVPLRATSALLGTLASMLFAWVAWRWAGPGAGSAASVMYALSAFEVYYAQEARCYTLLALLGIGVLAVHLELFRRERLPWGAWGGLAVLEALFILTHYLAAFFMLGLATAVAFVPRLRRHGKAWLVTQVVGALFTSPWAATMAYCFHRIHGLRMLTDFRVSRDLPAPFVLFTMGRSVIPQQGSRWYWLDLGVVGVGAALAALSLLGGAWSLVRRRRGEECSFLLCACVLPVALMTVFSLVLFPCFSVVYAKYMIWMHAPLLLLAAAWVQGVLDRSRRWTVLCVVALYLAVNGASLTNYFTNVEYRKAPAYREAVAQLRMMATPGDEVLYSRVQDGQGMDPLLAGDAALQGTRRGLLVDIGSAEPTGRFGSSCFLEWDTAETRPCHSSQVWIVLFRDWRARREEGMERQRERIYRQAHALAGCGLDVTDAIIVRGLEVLRLDRR